MHQSDDSGRNLGLEAGKVPECELFMNAITTIGDTQGPCPGRFQTLICYSAFHEKSVTGVVLKTLPQRIRTFRYLLDELMFHACQWCGGSSKGCQTNLDHLLAGEYHTHIFPSLLNEARYVQSSRVLNLTRKKHLRADTVQHRFSPMRVRHVT